MHQRTATYSSIPAQLFQGEIDYGRRFGNREPHGWTTLRGYWREAGKLAQLIDENRKVQNKPYKWAVALNIEHVLTVAEIKSIWKEVCRGLRQHDIAALWVREPSPQNHVNYHLIVASEHTEQELQIAIDASIPAGVRYHKQIARIKPKWEWSLVRYVVKAKVKGFVDGKFRRDKYADKRLLFVRNVGLQKSGTIGSFLGRPKCELWRTVIAREKRISDGLETPEVREQVDRLFELLGGSVSRRRIERSIGFHGVTEGVGG